MPAVLAVCVAVHLGAHVGQQLTAQQLPGTAVPAITDKTAARQSLLQQERPSSLQGDHTACLPNKGYAQGLTEP
jgi:hypothetical protein